MLLSSYPYPSSRPTPHILVGGTPRRGGLEPEPLPAFLVALGERLLASGVFGRAPNHGLINEYDGDEGIMAHKGRSLLFYAWL